MRPFVVAAALAALPTAPALAQTEQPESDSTIVVHGGRAADAVRDFVAEIGTSPGGTNLARWDRKVCVGVENLAADYAQKLVDRVSLVALAVGLEPGEPGCRANILILADSDGDGLATRLVNEMPERFRPREADNTNLGRDALERFKTSGAPVRWWHVSQTVMADTGANYLPGSSVRVRGVGRLQANVRQEMAYAVIILDAHKIGSISFASLADYVSMVALAQVDSEADMRGYASVLNLFAGEGEARTARLTSWDLDYLIALYDTPGDASSASREASRIARKMMGQPSTSDQAGQ